MKLLLAFISLAVAHTNGHHPHKSTATTLGPDDIIVNRYFAFEGKAPYIVSLYLGTDGSNSGAVCDGTIIASNWVLTAAHCLTTDYAVIYYGSYYEWQGKLSHTVRKENFIRHNRWPLTNGHDIGLIRTPTVSFSSSIDKVALPKFGDTNDTMVNEWVVVCGWGGLGNDELTSSLLCMDGKVSGNEECNIFNPFGPITTANLCTRGICGGHSGSPLVTLDNPRLIGIIPFAKKHCDEAPYGFTRIVTHLDWIRNETGIAYY